LKQEFLSRLDSREAASASPVWALVPEHNGRHGHPYIAGRELIEAFLRAPAGSTARDIEHTHQDHIVYVPVLDPRVIANIDTPDDYSALS